MPYLFNPFTGKFDFTHDRTSLGLAVTDSPVFSTVKLSGLTDGYLPYHVADATGFVDSLLFQNASGVGIGGVPSVLLHILGTTASHVLRSDIGLDFNPVVYPSSSTPFTAAAVSGSAGLEVGAYRYRVSFTTALGETELSTYVSVTTTAGNQHVDLSGLPVSSDYRVTGRKVYRGPVGSSWVSYLIATIADNTTTTYHDELPDASLSGLDYSTRTNTTCSFITNNGSRAFVLDKNLTAFGLSTAAALTSGGRNTLIGYLSGSKVTSGFDHTFIGHQTGFNTTTSQGCIAIGSYSLVGVAGNFNSCVGVYSGYSVTGAGNTLIGHQSGFSNTSGNYNTNVGKDAGYTNATGASSVFLGYKAGYYETASSKLFIDNQQRSSEADGRVKALVYGIFASTTAAQYFTVNGHLVALEDLTAPHVLCHEIKTDTTTATDLTITCGTDKTLVLTETVWDDFPPNPIITAKLGSSAPTLATFVGNIEQYTFDATNDYVVGSTEIPHGWKEGTAIIPHIHWATNGVDSTARGVKWQLEYSVGDFNETFSSASQITVDATIPASTTDRTHYVSNFTTNIDGTNLKIGAYIVWRLNRIATAHANGAPTADPFALAIGFHGEFDTLGSRGTTSK